MTAHRFARETRVTALLVIALTSAIGAGCARLKPYQRGRLAHPTMLLVDTTDVGSAHVYAIQEGAVGGASEVSGGCGCN